MEGRYRAGGMLRTPSEGRRLLELAGYVWDAASKTWTRPGPSLGFLRDRTLDGSVSAGMTPQQIAEWIKAGETGAQGT